MRLKHFAYRAAATSALQTGAAAPAAVPDAGRTTRPGVSGRDLRSGFLLQPRQWLRPLPGPHRLPHARASCRPVLRAAPGGPGPWSVPWSVLRPCGLLGPPCEDPPSSVQGPSKVPPVPLQSAKARKHIGDENYASLVRLRLTDETRLHFILELTFRR